VTVARGHKEYCSMSNVINLKSYEPIGPFIPTRNAISLFHRHPSVYLSSVSWNITKKPGILVQTFHGLLQSLQINFVMVSLIR
jgi:hypothetical protein